MRDLGVLGEVAFSQMCAEVGLINNGSQIDSKRPPKTLYQSKRI